MSEEAEGRGGRGEGRGEEGGEGRKISVWVNVMGIHVVRGGGREGIGWGGRGVVQG